MAKNARQAAAIGAALIALSGPSSAQAPAGSYRATLSSEYLKALSALPDWTGVWRTKGRASLLAVADKPTFAKGNRDPAPFKPEYAKEYDELAARAEDQGNMESAHPIVDSHTLYCLAGMPRVIATPFDYQFQIQPGIVTIIIGGEVRTIYTDGRSFPPEEERWAKIYGWSRGRWEGDTLVIETKDMKPDLWADPTPMTLSAQASIIERMRRISPTEIEDQVTITDPVKFTGPWKFTRAYVPLKNDQWLDEKESCGGPQDRNPIVNGRVTVVLPKQPD